MPRKRSLPYRPKQQSRDEQRGDPGAHLCPSRRPVIGVSYERRPLPKDGRRRNSPQHLRPLQVAHILAFMRCSAHNAPEYIPQVGRSLPHHVLSVPR